jgi:ribonuclease P protein component
LRGAEFQALFQTRGRRQERPSFVALFRLREGASQVGFAVGRRIGGAVARNRARRRLREAYRRERAPHAAGFEVVFVGRAPLLTRSFSEILGEMRETMSALVRAARTAAAGAGEVRQ